MTTCITVYARKTASDARKQTRAAERAANERADFVTYFIHGEAAIAVPRMSIGRFTIGGRC